jgi:hypothetical protein
LNEFCTLDPLESSETCDFIDLLKNEEKFTGYAGPTANRIWSKIYSELCFLPEEVTLPIEPNYSTYLLIHLSLSLDPVYYDHPHSAVM